MSTKIKILLAVLGVSAAGAAVFFLTRSKGSGLLAYVPNDAMMVMRIDLPEIVKQFKENEKEIKSMSLWKKFNEASNEPLMRAFQGIMKNPETSGIDFSYDCMFFMQVTQRSQNSGLLFRLKNAAEFGKYLKNNTPAGASSGTEAGVEYAEFGTGVFISWNNDVALVTDQKADSKTYFADILNKKNPGARGNLLLNRIEDKSSMVDLVFRIDDLFSNKNKQMEESGFHNPFPAGSAIVASLDMKKGEVESEMTMVSTDKNALEKLDFFKSGGKMGDYENGLFINGIPYGAFSTSIDIPKFLAFTSLINPDMKAKVNDPEMKEIADALSGDLVFGMTLREESFLNQMKGYSYMEEEEEPMESPYGMILHIGTKNKNLLRQKLDNITPAENGIYRLGGFLNIYAMEFNDHFIVSNEKKTLELIRSKNGKLTPEKPFLIPDVCKKSGLSAVIDYSSMNKIIQKFMIPGDGITPDTKLAEALGSQQYMYLQNGKLFGKSEMKDKSVHPLMLFMRLMNNMMEKEEVRRKKMEETEKQMREDLKAFQSEGTYN